MDLDSARNLKAEILDAAGVAVGSPGQGTLKADFFGIGTTAQIAGNVVKGGYRMYKSLRDARAERAYRRRTDRLEPGVVKSTAIHSRRGAGKGLPFAVGILRGPTSRDARIVLIGRDARLRHHPKVLQAMKMAAGEAVWVLEDEPRPFSHWQPARRRPLELGISISSGANPVGTLGAFVTTNDGEICMLSCGHVLAPPRRSSTDGGVLQPGSRDGGTSSDVVGFLKTAIPLSASRGNVVDCAVAHRAEGVDPTSTFAVNGGGSRFSLRGAARRELSIDETVLKFGRTTGMTTGRVFAVEVDNYLVNMGTATAPMRCLFNNQIQVRAESDDRVFAARGDSGSLLIDEDGFAHGMLFSGSMASGRGRLALTTFNPMDAVLEELDAELFVG